MESTDWYSGTLLTLEKSVIIKITANYQGFSINGSFHLTEQAFGKEFTRRSDMLLQEGMVWHQPACAKLLLGLFVVHRLITPIQQDSANSQHKGNNDARRFDLPWSRIPV